MTDEQNTVNNKKAGEKLVKALNQAKDLPESEQKKLNIPLEDPTGVDETNKKFLEDIVAKIESGKIILFRPASLINQEVYNKLSEKIQGETDMNAVSLLARLSDIKGLHDTGQTNSYQMQNLVEQVRLTKERLEKDAGDVFII